MKRTIKNIANSAILLASCIMLMSTIWLAVMNREGGTNNYLAVPKQVSTLPPATVVEANTPVTGPPTKSTSIPNVQPTTTAQANPTTAPLQPALPADTPADYPTGVYVINETPIPVTFTMPVAITATEPLTVTSIPALPDASIEVQGLTWLMAFAVARLILLCILDIPERNIFKKIYHFAYTALFILVEAIALEPVYKYGNILFIGGLWFVFWIVVYIIEHLLTFLPNLTSDK